jgi:hypothetical protein
MHRSIPVALTAFLLLSGTLYADEAVDGHLLRIQYQEHAINDLQNALATCRERMQAIKEYHESVDPEDSQALAELRRDYDKLLAARTVYNGRLLALLKNLAGEHAALAGKLDPQRALAHRSTAASLHFQRGRIYDNEANYQAGTDKMSGAGKSWENGNRAFSDSQKQWTAALGLHRQVNSKQSDRELRRKVEDCFNRRVDCLQNAKLVYKSLHQTHVTAARSTDYEILSKNIGTDWQKAAAAHLAYQRMTTELGKISTPKL